MVNNVVGHDLCRLLTTSTCDIQRGGRLLRGQCREDIVICDHEVMQYADSRGAYYATTNGDTCAYSIPDEYRSKSTYSVGHRGRMRVAFSTKVNDHPDEQSILFLNTLSQKEVIKIKLEVILLEPRWTLRAHSAAIIMNNCEC